LIRFSVVTISFNQAEFLRAAIDSVIAQRGDGIDVQYIVCDPGSTDGSREIIAEYGDAIDVTLFDKDRGPADGLNKGFAHADGDIFCYLNSDDMFLPGAFVRAAAEFARDPAVDVICGHATVIDGAGRTLRRVWSEPFGRLTSAHGAHIQIQPATFIRAQAFARSGGFDINDRSNWDGDLLVSLFLTGARIKIVDAFLGAYRIHDQSITGTGRLIEAHHRSAAQRFERLMGRPPRASDRPVALLLRLLKHLRRPHRALERLRKGPLFAR
jgi:glycosyltransferase involved in cell wall biosynthesis